MCGCVCEYVYMCACQPVWMSVCVEEEEEGEVMGEMVMVGRLAPGFQLISCD